MNKKHANGPWMAEKHPTGHYGIFQCDHAHQVAEVLDRNTTPEMVEANARLIAAAPNLLAALEQLKVGLMNEEAHGMWEADYMLNQIILPALEGLESNSSVEPYECPICQAMDCSPKYY